MAIGRSDGGKEKNLRILGSVLLLLTAMIWGTAFVGQRVGMEHIGPYTFTSVRNILSAAVLTPVIIALSRRASHRGAAGPGSPVPDDQRAARRDTITGGLLCGCFLSAASLFQQVGMIETSAGKSGFITAMYMLLVPVISFAVFRKRHSLFVWAAVAAGVFGLYLLCVTESFEFTRSDLLVLVSAFFFSCQILCVGRFVRRGDPVMMSLIQFLTVAVIAGILALIAERPSWGNVVSAAIPIIYCGVLSGGVGYTLQIVAQKFTDPTVASLLMSLESVFAVLAGSLLLHERMTSREAIGCVIMFFAIILVQIPDFFHFPLDIPPSGSRINGSEADE